MSLKSMGKITKGVNRINFTMVYGHYCYIIIDNFPQKFSPYTERHAVLVNHFNNEGTIFLHTSLPLSPSYYYRYYYDYYYYHYYYHKGYGRNVTAWQQRESWVDTTSTNYCCRLCPVTTQVGFLSVSVSLTLCIRLEYAWPRVYALWARRPVSRMCNVHCGSECIVVHKRSLLYVGYFFSVSLSLFRCVHEQALFLVYINV